MSLEPAEFCTADCRSGKIPKEHLEDPTKAAKSYLQDSPEPDEPEPEGDPADDGDSEAAAVQAADMGMGAAPAPKNQSSWGPVSVRVSQGDANAIPIRVDISHSLTALRRCKAGALEPGAIGKVALRLERDGEHMKLEPARSLEAGFLKCLRWVLLGGSGHDGAIRPSSRQPVKSGAVVAVQLDL